MKPTMMRRPAPARLHALSGALWPAVLLASVATAACSRERLLEVETPDQIRPSDAATAAGAGALRAAAIGNFHNFYSGTTNVGANLYGGLISDELINARPGADHIDQRAFNPNTFPNTSWNNFSQAYTQLIRARRALLEFSPAGAARATQLGQLQAYSSLALSIAGELFCNGVPLSNVDDANPAFETVTNAQMFQRAVAHADSALTLLAATGGDVPLRYLARIAKARALVNLARYADAAAVVGAGGDGAGSVAVPTDFVYNAEYSATTLANTIFDWMVNTANFGPSDREGGNGLDFITARDPRVVVSATSRLGQDGSTRVFTIQGYANGAAPTRLATGVEARLIEAEAALRAGNGSWLTTLNALRANTALYACPTGALGCINRSAPLPALADPGTPEARVDLLFAERGYWLHGTSHRLGDLRRLVRQYGRATETVFPTGAYVRPGVNGALTVGTYGPDVSFPIPVDERNNPEVPENYSCDNTIA